MTPEQRQQATDILGEMAELREEWYDRKSVLVGTLSWHIERLDSTPDWILWSNLWLTNNDDLFYQDEWNRLTIELLTLLGLETSTPDDQILERVLSALSLQMTGEVTP